MNPYRQGDVILVPVAAIPEGAKALARTNGKTILALGEATGHHHRFESPAATMLRTADGAEYLRIDDVSVTLRPVAVEDRALRDVRMHDGTVVRFDVATFTKAEAALHESVTLTVPGELLYHEEHAAQVIAPGIYELPGQREYAAEDMEPIRVQD